jgi:hypothetical protein
MKVVKIISTVGLQKELKDVGIANYVKYMEKNYGISYITSGQFYILDDIKFSYYMLLHSESIESIV